MLEKTENGKMIFPEQENPPFPMLKFLIFSIDISFCCIFVRISCDCGLPEARKRNMHHTHIIYNIYDKKKKKERRRIQHPHLLHQHNDGTDSVGDGGVFCNSRP